MGMNLTYKLIRDHLVKGEMIKGSEIGIRIDQTLTQDSTGTMAYLQLEAMGIDRVKTERSVAYVDHNMLQAGPENADDHRFIQTAAKKYGIYFSRPGNGICHQVHLERFSKPGKTLLGSDSHTPTCGGAGMLAIGAGGLDVAVAMAGGEYNIIMPEVIGIELKGELKSPASAKDIILEVLRHFTVKGGINRVFEYFGDGVKTLTVPERSTITNMGAELGATTSIFPSDEKTEEFFKAQGRLKDYKAVSADFDAVYDDVYTIDLDNLRPLVACPHSPDLVVSADELKNVRLTQVAIGSCTNSSYTDMMKVADILSGKTVAENVSLVISPGSKQVLTMLSKNGALTKMIDAGARILESGCGPCIGMGQAPESGGVSLRTFNRNFRGRCGTPSAHVYLASPEIAAMSAILGRIAGEDDFKDTVIEKQRIPDFFMVNDNMFIPSEGDPDTEIVRGPNIKPFPKAVKPMDSFIMKALIKAGDDVTTDHIMPSDARLLPYRSNIPYLSTYCLSPIDPDFSQKASENGGGIIIAGKNYGQGSSREHAALAPLYLGIKAVIAKSFARIHFGNLVNNGILPFVFENEDDYDLIDEMDDLEFSGNLRAIDEGHAVIKDLSNGKKFNVILKLSDRQKEIIKEGGLLNLMGKKSRGEL